MVPSLPCGRYWQCGVLGNSVLYHCIWLVLGIEKLSGEGTNLKYNLVEKQLKLIKNNKGYYNND
jgi:hypothetical protein